MVSPIEVAATKLATDAAKDLLKSIKESLARWGAEVDSTQERIEAALERHQAEVKSWAEEISFKDLLRAKATSKVFVPLDIYLLPQRQRMVATERLRSAPLSKLLKNTEVSHLIILGQPGAGKTTAIKHLCQEIVAGTEVYPAQNFPLLIRLRDLNVFRTTEGDFQEVLLDKLQSILDIPIRFAENAKENPALISRRAIKERVIIQVLESLRPVILLDGLDEIVLKKVREGVVNEVRQLAVQLERARLVLTARTGEFAYHIEKATTFEIAPLSHKQIEKFALAWLGKKEAQYFVAQVDRSPFADTAIKPLTLAHLCAIYERVRKIPEKPKSVYKKIVALLLEEWDQQRSVTRVSSYAGFEVDRKQEFLSELAHRLTVSNRAATFSREDLLEVYSKIYGNYGLPRSEAQEVVDELETHTGLIIQSAVDLFEFSHKSLQEYLTAEFIKGLPEIPGSVSELQTMPNELAIATALSSRPSEYLYHLVIRHLSEIKLSFHFVRTFINRLLLEKPDFELTEKVGIALLCIYSQYLRAWIDDAKQLQLFTYDPLYEEFETLATLIKQRVPIAQIAGVYSIESTSFALDGKEVWRLELKASPAGALKFYTLMRVLPKVLWVRRSLIEENADNQDDVPADSTK
jgi:hypothetical protein